MSTENREFLFPVAETELDIRIDNFITEKLDISRTNVQKLIKNQNVTVNGKKVKSNYKVKPDEIVEVRMPEPEMLDVAPEKMELDIVFEDDHLIVINKPAGLVVHPAPGNYSGTLVNGLLYHCGHNLSGINGVIRPGIVHRLDKDTSGLIVVAKSDLAHNDLALQIKEKQAKRGYMALVHGVIKEPAGRIDAPIGRDTVDRKRMDVTDKNSKAAVTKYKVIERFNQYTLIEAWLETGRTHQIRAHFKYLSHPVVGDPLYGPQKAHFDLNRQLLHAKVLAFKHPITKEKMEFSSPLPSVFVKVINKLQD
ncbi:23S rRNA pseudouridine1911/1915/1917 synthase [Desulfitispora alkaliphila]|uniref:RluA family pseudouridine synthase n=1 Tax=Desulfitispora alkaliphila TaxID=622674 RepID=UPI003D20CDD4